MSIKAHNIRGVDIVLEDVVANIYQVPIKTLIQQCKRQSKKFQEHSFFQITKEEAIEIGIPYKKRLPYAFTTLGMLTATTLLKSKPAIDFHIHIVKSVIDGIKQNRNFEEVFFMLKDINV